jgi:hypothetical protein
MQGDTDSKDKHAGQSLSLDNNIIAVGPDLGLLSEWISYRSQCCTAADGVDTMTQSYYLAPSLHYFTRNAPLKRKSMLWQQAMLVSRRDIIVWWYLHSSREKKKTPRTVYNNIIEY